MCLVFYRFKTICAQVADQACSKAAAPLSTASLPCTTQIRDFTEVERLAAAERLEDLLLVGNPLYNDHKDNSTLPEYRVEVRCQQPGGCLCWVKDQDAGLLRLGCRQLAAAKQLLFLLHTCLEPCCLLLLPPCVVRC